MFTNHKNYNVESACVICLVMSGSIYWPGPGPNNILGNLLKKLNQNLILVSTRELDFVLNSFIFMSNSKSGPAKREPGTLEIR